MKVFLYIKGQSERVPRKNFRELGGAPLYLRMLNRLNGHDVYVDTDSPEIIEGCKDLPHVTAYARKLEHCTAVNPVTAMTSRFLNECVSNPREPVALVHVTSPFLKMDTLAQMEAIVRDEDYDSAATVTEMHEFFYRGEGGSWIPVNHDGREIKRSQDLTPLTYPNMAAYVFTRESHERCQHRIGSRPYFKTIHWPESLDIDWEEDFQMAEAVIAGGLAT